MHDLQDTLWLTCCRIDDQHPQPTSSPPRGRRPTRDADEAYRTIKHALEEAIETEDRVKDAYRRNDLGEVYKLTNDYYSLVSEAMTTEEGLRTHERTGLVAIWLGMTDAFGRKREYLPQHMREAYWDEQASQQLQKELEAAVGETAADE